MTALPEGFPIRPHVLADPRRRDLFHFDDAERVLTSDVNSSNLVFISCSSARPLLSPSYHSYPGAGCPIVVAFSARRVSRLLRSVRVTIDHYSAPIFMVLGQDRFIRGRHRQLDRVGLVFGKIVAAAPCPQTERSSAIGQPWDDAMLLSGPVDCAGGVKFDSDITRCHVGPLPRRRGVLIARGLSRPPGPFVRRA